MSQRYMAFDCETGGFDENEADLLTVYFAILDEEYKILEELDLKLKPDDRLPIAEAGALKVNGINLQKHLEDPGTVTYSIGQKQVISMLDRHLKKNGRYSNIMPFGYNVPFDERWVKKHLLPMSVWEKKIHYKSVDVMKTVDDLKRFGWFPKELGSLGTVVEFLGLTKRNAHEARSDVLMTIDVDKKIIEIMKSKKENSGAAAVDLISLLEAE